MRENKFRGVSVKGGKFVYGGIVRANTVDGNCWAIKDTMYNINNGKINLIPKAMIPETVGQYTESKDKNGKEIYEGDIIQVPDSWEEFGIMSGEKYEIYFAYGGFRLKPKRNKTQKGFWLEDGKEFEVIGNIHENPELLQQH